MLIILGKTASGKDAIVNKLIEEYGYEKIITYTTRPMRNNEIQEHTYHFISDVDFKQRISDNFFAEYKFYNTQNGIWYYGSSVGDYKKSKDKSVIILTPEGLKKILDLKIPFRSIYIYANNKTIKNRLMKRGDNKEEADRRLKQDNLDFKGIEYIVDKIIYNNETDTIEDVVPKIVNFVEGKH